MLNIVSYHKEFYTKDVVFEVLVDPCKIFMFNYSDWGLVPVVFEIPTQVLRRKIVREVNSDYE